MSLPLIPADKANHIAYGAAQSLIGAIAALAVGQLMWLGALILSLAVAVGKELRDRLTKRGTPDALDAVATVACALPAVIVGWLA